MFIMILIEFKTLLYSSRCVLSMFFLHLFHEKYWMIVYVTMYVCMYVYYLYCTNNVMLKWSHCQVLKQYLHSQLKCNLKRIMQTKLLRKNVQMTVGRFNKYSHLQYIHVHHSISAVPYKFIWSFTVVADHLNCIGIFAWACIGQNDFTKVFRFLLTLIKEIILLHSIYFRNTFL